MWVSMALTCTSDNKNHWINIKMVYKFLTCILSSHQLYVTVDFYHLDQNLVACHQLSQDTKIKCQQIY